MPYDEQALVPLDEPYAAFLDRLKLPAATRDLFESLPCFFAGARAADLRLLHVVDWVAQLDHSVWAQFVALEETFADGTGSLVRALAEEARGGDGAAAELRLSTTVASIAQDGDGVRVQTAAGEAFRRRPRDRDRAGRDDGSGSPSTRRCRPTSSPPSRAGHRVRHAQAVADGRGRRGAVRLRGHRLAAAVDLLRGGDRRRRRCTAFAGIAEELDPDDRDAVEAALQPYLPGARVRAVDHEAWNDDPFSDGISFRRPGCKGAAGAQRRGEIHFAGADVAIHWPAWMAGAIDSGAAAARDVLAAART